MNCAAVLYRENSLYTSGINYMKEKTGYESKTTKTESNKRRAVERARAGMCTGCLHGGFNRACADADS